MPAVIPEILERLGRGRVLWAGDHSPRGDMSPGAAIYDMAADFRLPPEFHQAFDLVLAVERDLALIKQWPFVVDEALRAVRPGGIVVFRTSQSAMLSVFQLANFIHRWTQGRYELIDAVSDPARFLLAVRLTHKAERSASVGDFTFGLITDGRKPEAVAAFVESVLALGCASPDIAICGPDSVLLALSGLARHCRLVPQPDSFRDAGWITRKKNSIVEASARENILIAHDRYVLPPDFLTRLAAFGGDFDVIVPRQTTTSGEALPDVVMLSDPLNWTTPGWMEFGDYHPFGYVNGGVMIAKTERLRTTRWSELLFWGQAEDVDLSRRLADQGAVFRCAREIVVLSAPTRPGFVEGFERIPLNRDSYPQTHRPDWGRQEPLAVMGTEPEPSGRLGLEQEIDFSKPDSLVRSPSRGVVWSSDWHVAHGAIRCSAMENGGAFTVKLAGSGQGLALQLSLVSEPSSNGGCDFMVNSIPVRGVRVSERVVELALPDVALTGSAIVHLRPRPNGESVPAVRSIKLGRAGAGFFYTPGETLEFALGQRGSTCLGTGWERPEEWGVWTHDVAGKVRVPVDRRSARAFSVVATLRANLPPGSSSLAFSVLNEGRTVARGTLTEDRQRQKIRFRVRGSRAADAVSMEFRVERLTRLQGVVDDRKVGIGLIDMVMTRRGWI